MLWKVLLKISGEEEQLRQPITWLSTLKMFQIESSITINKPIDTVFTFISDNENDPKWCVPVVETTRIVGDAPGANTRYTFASKAGLFTLRGEFKYWNLKPLIV